MVVRLGKISSSASNIIPTSKSSLSSEKRNGIMVWQHSASRSRKRRSDTLIMPMSPRRRSGWAMHGGAVRHNLVHLTKGTANHRSLRRSAFPIRLELIAGGLECPDQFIETSASMNRPSPPMTIKTVQRRSCGYKRASRFRRVSHSFCNRNIRVAKLVVQTL